ncbi:MAG: M23 family metallopeptidase [Bacteroides sp.]|nr:M23 family metallopeptidase [Bacteroides sp.]MCM1379740.1 M23 family metallopeptidase [Bacteroides sp.]MCM1445719.1 M23 family metallopeptidase [Prevotella sp.]
MSKKIYYRYNEKNGSYERVYPSRRSRRLATLGHLILSLLLGGGVFFLLNGVVDLPKERMLRAENRQLKDDLLLLNARMDRAQAVMSDLADRDNNFYRVMMQADRISDAKRYAGLERSSLRSLSDKSLASTLNEKMNLLEREIVVQSQSLDELRALALSRADRLSHIPAIQPVAEVNLKQMASGYGRRVDPIYGTVKMHEGMDFACDVGTPVYATGDGTISAAGWHSGYGNRIDINHGFSYTTRYAHLSKISVKVGQTVKRGDLIGYSGNTGKSTGPHVHYEVRLKDVPQNPVNYYFYDLTPEEYAAMIEHAENAGHVMD